MAAMTFVQPQSLATSPVDNLPLSLLGLWKFLGGFNSAPPQGNISPFHSLFSSIGSHFLPFAGPSSHNLPANNDWSSSTGLKLLFLILSSPLLESKYGAFLGPIVVFVRALLGSLNLSLLPIEPIISILLKFLGLVTLPLAPLRKDLNPLISVLFYVVIKVLGPVITAIIPTLRPLLSVIVNLLAPVFYLVWPLFLPVIRSISLSAIPQLGILRKQIARLHRALGPFLHLIANKFGNILLQFYHSGQPAVLQPLQPSLRNIIGGGNHPVLGGFNPFAGGLYTGLGRLNPTLGSLDPVVGNLKFPLNHLSPLLSGLGVRL